LQQLEGTRGCDQAPPVPAPGSLSGHGLGYPASLSRVETKPGEELGRDTRTCSSRGRKAIGGKRGPRPPIWEADHEQGHRVDLYGAGCRHSAVRLRALRGPSNAPTAVVSKAQSSPSSAAGTRPIHRHLYPIRLRRSQRGGRRPRCRALGRLAEGCRDMSGGQEARTCQRPGEPAGRERLN